MNTNGAEPSSNTSGGIDGARPRNGTLARTAESMAVFAIGAAIMAFIAPGAPRDGQTEWGLAGHDSFYHVKMALLLPEHGLVKTFPWLKFAYFTEEGDDFVSHHYGFHVLLMPFVKIAEWTTGDGLAGGRWAVIFFFGCTLAVFNLLLIAGGVRWRWLWLLLFLLMPFQFFNRHAYVRAIGPSLIAMMLITLFMFGRRHVLCAIVVLAYTHLYLGGVIYAPLLVGLFALASVIGPKEDRGFPWRIVLWSASGWLLGVLIHPYAGGMIEFLRLQVFGSGLTPDISVGREWKEYEGVWWFAQMSGNLLLAWAMAVALRFRLGPRLSAGELYLLLANFAFLFLTAKARRFIEYWPPFCLLSAAFLTAPLLARAATWFDGVWTTGASRRDRRLAGIWTVGLIAAVAGLLLSAGRIHGVEDFVKAWPMWAGVTVLYMIVPLTGIVRTGAAGRAIRVGQCLLVGAGCLAAVVCFAAPSLLSIRRTARSAFDVSAVRGAMEFLQSVSQPGDVVFTDDWDIFPVYFYYNSHNDYIVGLDPKFTQHRRPELWERYVKVSRGQVPANESVETIAPDGRRVKETIEIRLEDIRDHFGAKYVVTDSDHTALAGKLALSGEFAELIYPSTSYEESRDAPYLVFRVRR